MGRHAGGDRGRHRVVRRARAAVHAATMPSSSASPGRRSAVVSAARSARSSSVGERLPVGVVAAGDGDPRVVAGAPVDAVGHHGDVGVAVARRRPAVDGLVEHGRRQEVHARLGLGEVEVLALAGAPPVVERGEQRAQREARRRVVAVGAERAARRAVGPAGEVEEPDRARRPSCRSRRTSRSGPDCPNRQLDIITRPGRSAASRSYSRSSAARPRGENDSMTTSDQRTRSSSTSRASGWREVEADAALAGRHVEQQAAGVVAGHVVDERADRAGDVEVVAGLDADRRRRRSRPSPASWPARPSPT